MSEYIFFYVGLAFLTIHEMDAIRCREWRMLPLLSSLKDHTGYVIFVLAHIPLFTWIFWELQKSPIKDSFIIGFDVFMLIHVLLHLLFLRHKNNEFKDWVSWSFIAGAGLFGLMDLLI